MVAAALAFVLLLVMPGEALWRDWSKRRGHSLAHRYSATIARALALLVALVIVAKIEGITAAELGIGIRLGIGGFVGLAIALLVVSGLTAATLLAKTDPAKVERHQTHGLMPNNPHELRLFLVLTPLIGFAWELLYRGYLLWWLTPFLGIPLAVSCASVSYGLAHGWKNAREGFSSIAAAFLFTIGYAITGSLWWLIIIHIGLPLIGFMATHRATASRNATAET